MPLIAAPRHGICAEKHHGGKCSVRGNRPPVWPLFRGWKGNGYENKNESGAGRRSGGGPGAECLRIQLAERAPPAPAPASAPVSQNADLAAKLPESIKTAGVIKIGVDATYAPNEFLAGDGKTVQGFDVDLFNAVAAKFGVKTEWQPADFSSIITGVPGEEVRHRHLRRSPSTTSARSRSPW